MLLLTYADTFHRRITHRHRSAEKLGQRLNEHAAHLVIDLPDTRLGDSYAAKMGVRTIEQTSRIETVTEQLKQWREELVQQKNQNVSQSV